MIKRPKPKAKRRAPPKRAPLPACLITRPFDQMSKALDKDLGAIDNSLSEMRQVIEILHNNIGEMRQEGARGLSEMRESLGELRQAVEILDNKIEHLTHLDRDDLVHRLEAQRTTWDTRIVRQMIDELKNRLEGGE